MTNCDPKMKGLTTKYIYCWIIPFIGLQILGLVLIYIFPKSDVKNAFPYKPLEISLPAFVWSTSWLRMSGEGH